MSETIFSVKDMSCDNCVRHVTEALREIEGVERVSVDLASGRVVVGHAPSARVERMIEALDEAGYPAAPAS